MIGLLNMTSTAFFITVFWILFSLLAVHAQDVASYGDSCTHDDVSNCTLPQMSCSAADICNCSQGYIINNTGTHDTICTKPSYNQSCDATIGCQDYLQCTNTSGFMTCQCLSLSQYFNLTAGGCSPKPSTGQRCDVTIGCEEFSDCMGATPGPPTCQCNSSNVYYDNVILKCLPVSEMQVVIIRTTISATTVTFSWDGISPESGVQYQMEWTPADGRINYIDLGGGQLAGLQPGSLYNVTFISMLSGDASHPEKRYLGPNVTVCTKASYGGLCDTCVTCEDDQQTCVEAVDNKYRCLCGPLFNATETGNCTSLDQLSVTNISSTSTVSTVNFTWSTSMRLSPVTYTIEWYPIGGRLDSINRTGAQVSQLAPGTLYGFLISSVLPENAYDYEKRVTPPEWTIWTKLAYLGECASPPSDDCQYSTECLPINEHSYLCLCGNDYYYNRTSEVCSSLEDLKVSGVSTTATTTTVSLTWTALPVTVNYTVEWSPSGGSLDSVGSTGAQVSGLTSGTIYTFTVVSHLLSDKYYLEKNVSELISPVITKPTTGEKCEVSVGCDEFNECVDSPPGASTCQCNSSSIFDSIKSMCLPMSQYQVSIISTTTTDTTMTFTWDLNNYESGVDYQIQWKPAYGQIDYIYPDRGQISGLQPGSQYKVTFVSVLSGDASHPEKKYVGPNMTVCTNALYGEDCGSCVSCQDDQQHCNEATDKTSRCLCGDTFFNATQTGNCTSLDQLLVTNISSTSTVSTVNLTWSIRTHISSVTYTIEWYPSGGRLDSITNTGAQVSQLAPEYLYDFTISSVLPANVYEDEKRVTTPVWTIWTKLAYSGDCRQFNSKECQYLTECIHVNDDTYLCLCGNDYYFNNTSGACSSLEDLKVSGVSTTTTTTRASLTWTALPVTVNYTVEWSPSGGSLDSVGSTGAQVSGLTSGTIYNFTVVSHLPSDKYYPEKNVSELISPVITISAYGEKCDAIIGCQEFQQCTNESGFMICQCSSKSYHFDPINGECSPKPTTGENCEIPIGCEEFNDCVGASPGQMTCQCNSANVFLDNINSLCLPMSDLQVSVASTTISATTVTFTWYGSSPESGVEYQMEWTPADGRINYIYPEGAQLVGLQPGSLYNVTFISMLSGDASHPEKKYFGPNVTVCTNTLYGEQCDKCGTCQDDQQICIDAVDKTSRCLCGDTFFNASQTANCTSLDELSVTNVSFTSTVSTVNFTWTTGTHVSSATYMIGWYPTGGLVDTISSAGAVVSLLTPGNLYSFTISVALPGNAYDDEKSSTTLELSVWTKVPYLGDCAPFTNAECQELTQCLRAKDDNYRCMCADVYYFNDTRGVCSTLEDLKVSGVSTTTTTTTASLTWTALPVTVNYTVEWSPSGGSLDSVSSTGAQVSGLTSGTIYNFTVVVHLPSDKYYPERSVSELISPVMTESLFGGQCGKCQDSQQTCMEAMDNKSRCLCGDTFFNATQTGNCTSLDELIVDRITSTYTVSTVKFNWEADMQVRSVTYKIQWYPSEGHLDILTDRAAQVSQLSPGSMYYFTIVAGLPANGYDHEKHMNSQELTVWTRIPHLGSCEPFTRIECQELTECLRANDDKDLCMCGQAYYFNNTRGVCSSLEDLKVSGVSTTATTTTASLTWTALPVTVNYTVEWSPSGGSLDSVGSTGAQVSGLTSGTIYTFTVVSHLLSDKYYPDKNVSELISPVMTGTAPDNSNNSLDIGVAVGVTGLLVIFLVIISIVCYRRRVQLQSRLWSHSALQEEEPPSSTLADGQSDAAVYSVENISLECLASTSQRQLDAVEQVGHVSDSRDVQNLI